MKFVFKARNQKGEFQTGIADFPSEEAAIRVLNSKGLTPISVRAEREMPKVIKEVQRVLEGANQKDQVMFFRQLSTLVGAGVPIVFSLRAVSEQTSNQYLKIVIGEIADDVEDGTPLSESMMKHGDTFSPIVYATIRAGEISGNLHNAINFIANNIEKNYRLNSKIIGALFYPAFVVMVAIVLGFVMAVVVLPKLTQVIVDMDIEIAWHTMVVIFIGDTMSKFWWAIALVVFAIIGIFIYYIRTEDGKREWDQIKIKIPIIGNLLKYVYIARFATNLSMLMTGGISVVKALTIVADVVNSSVYKGIILRSADEVRSGGDMSTVFLKSQEFPPLVSRMIKIGEETGKMNESLDAIADFYEKEGDDLVKNLTSLIEPVLIVILGVGVALLVFAILLPIYSIADQF